MALSRVVSETFSVKNYRDLEIPVKTGYDFLLVFYSDFVTKTYRF